MTEGRKVVLLNGEYVDWNNAKLHVTTHALLYGSAVFEGIRAYASPDSKQLFVFRLREHIVRLLNNAKVLRLKQPLTVDAFSEKIVELLNMNNFHSDVYIRPVVYFGEGPIGLKPLKQSTDYFVFAVELGNYFGEERALRVGISSWVRPSNNSLPPSAKVNGSYVNSMLASMDAKDAGYDEAILLTQNGYVSEGPGENLFIVKKGKLITPPLSADILDGITRDAIISIAAESGIGVVERDVARTELYTCDELFLCGTAAQISPVGSVDGRVIGDGKPGKITSELVAIFNDTVRGKDDNRRGWLTPVYR